MLRQWFQVPNFSINFDLAFQLHLDPGFEFCLGGRLKLTTRTEYFRINTPFRDYTPDIYIYIYILLISIIS